MPMCRSKLDAMTADTWTDNKVGGINYVSDVLHLLVSRVHDLSHNRY